MSSIPKKVTKIIRKDGISYRAAGGAEVASSETKAPTKDPNNNGLWYGQWPSKFDNLLKTLLTVNYTYG